MDRLPTVTHLQFLVLEHLRGGERAGSDTRALLAEHGARRTLAAFYQLMARLEEGGLVVGRYAQKTVRGQVVKERRYALTPLGEAAWQETCSFYRSRLGEPELVEGA